MKKQCFRFYFFLFIFLPLVYSVFFFIHSSMSNLRLGSVNLNGARDQKKRAMLFDTIKQKKY